MSSLPVAPVSSSMRAVRPPLGWRPGETSVVPGRAGRPGGREGGRPGGREGCHELVSCDNLSIRVKTVESAVD